jgi:hypothetical protein
MKNDLFYFTLFSYLILILYVVVYIGIIQINVKYIDTMHYYLNLFLSSMLILFFNPNANIREFTKNRLHLSNKMIYGMIHSAGWIILFDIGLHTIFMNINSTYDFIRKIL